MTPAGYVRANSSTSVPAGVCFRALVSRFSTARSMRTGSAKTTSDGSTSTRIARSANNGPRRRAVPRSRSERSTRSNSGASCPASNREKSSRLVMTCSSEPVLAFRAATRSRRVGSSMSSHIRSRVRPVPLITVRGVLRSCETVARKSLFMRSSSCRRVTVRCSSANRLAFCSPIPIWPASNSNASTSGQTRAARGTRRSGPPAATRPPRSGWP